MAFIKLNDVDLPVLPQQIEVTREGNNINYTLETIGDITLANIPRQQKIVLKSFFPINKFFSKGLHFSPFHYIKTINKWFEDKQVIRLAILSGEIALSMRVTIESFQYMEKAGEVGDIYYTLSLKEYREIQVKKVSTTVDDKHTTTPPVVNRPVDTPKTVSYKVVKGDTLWGIAKRFLGSGSRYMELATYNNLKNPNILRVGQVVKIP